MNQLLHKKLQNPHIHMSSNLKATNTKIKHDRTHHFGIKTPEN